MERILDFILTLTRQLYGIDSMQLEEESVCRMTNELPRRLLRL
jgi:hypothetical protein